MGIKVKIDGPVVEVNETQAFGASGFLKRTFVVEAKNENSRFDNPIKCTLMKDKCALADDLLVGDIAHAEGWLEGRRWDGPKGTQYFLDVNVAALMIEKGTAHAANSAAAPSRAAAKPVLASSYAACVQASMETSGIPQDQAVAAVKATFGEMFPGRTGKSLSGTDWAAIHNRITGAVPAPAPAENLESDPDDIPF